MSFEEFLKTDKSGKRFIISMDGCFLCKKYAQEMAHSIEDGSVILVESNSEDEDDILEYGITGVPVSISFDEIGFRKFIKYGILNSSQRNEFLTC